MDLRVKIISSIFWYPPVTVFPRRNFQSKIHTPTGMSSSVVADHGPFLWRLDNLINLLSDKSANVS